MPVVAVAGGTGGVGKTIVDVLTQQAKHDEVIVLTRKAQANDPILARAQQIEIDYTDISSLTKTLNANNIDTIISALSLYSDDESTAQLNLIKAAEAASPTTRFIPSEYSFIQTADLLHLDQSIKYFLDAANLLNECASLRYTRVIPGFFMDYWGMPHAKSNLENMTIAVDMVNCEAAIPGSGEDVLAMTYSYDVAEFIARLLEVDPKEWEEFSVVVGDEVTYNQLVGIGERVRGRKFKVAYDSVEDIEQGNVTVPPQPEGVGQGEDIVEATLLMDRLVVGKVFEFPAAGRSTEKFPDLKLIKAEEFVRKAWEGKA